MSLIGKLYRWFIVGSLKNTEEIPDVNQWMDFLAKLADPRDEYEASYNKYRCRKYYISPGKLVLLNFASLVRIVAALPHLFRHAECLPDVQNDTLIILRDNDVPTADIIPDSLTSRFSSFTEIDLPSSCVGVLCSEARSIFLSCLRRHPVSFYYLLMVLKELSIHSEVLQRHNVRAVAVYVAERNTATPLLRAMYERSGREFDSFMHGEYLLQMIQAYSSFSYFYVWDASYISMFDDLRFDCGEYKVYTPAKLKKKWDLENEKPNHFCTYYFSGESEQTIRLTAKLFCLLEQYGHKCKVRPHPRYSHVWLIKKYFKSNQIEDPSAVPMRESLASTKYVIGLTTTVLFEAKAEGKEIVLDDITDPARFSDLKARRFRLLAENPLLLSDFDQISKLLNNGSLL